MRRAFNPDMLKLTALMCRIVIIFIGMGTVSCNKTSSEKDEELPIRDEMVSFSPFANNPVFKGTGGDTWDQSIRERGYILRESDGYHLWYTGYREDKNDVAMALGYATSPDGIEWTRYQDNPIFSENWVEDIMVVKSAGIYHMFAEGRNDVAHRMTSTDKIHWTDHGPLQVQYTNGQPLTSGPYGTPTVFIEDSVWYLFYERNDEGIWLASSRNLNEWLNVKDEPVISRGPEQYDRYGVALNQVVAHEGLYYAYYHGTAYEDWREWSTNVAVSENLVDWKKYKFNPILEENKSSAILVNDGQQYRLYTMHPEVNLHFPDTTMKRNR
jgi:hypothetical protein